MVSSLQRKGVMGGLIWGLLSWVPYYTNYWGRIRGVLGIPATLGLNLELASGRGDAFIYSLLLAIGLGFFFMTVFQIFRKSIKIVGFLPVRGRKNLKGKGF